MPATATVALDATQWEQLWAIVARLSRGKPASQRTTTVELPAPPSDEEVKGLLRRIRPCGSYAAALCRVRTSCLEGSYGGILDTFSAMDRVARALLTKHLPWPHRRICSCTICKDRRSQDRAIGDFARRLAVEHQGFALETAISSAISGAQSLAEDCQPMMAVMRDLVELYCEHLKLPENRTQQTLKF